MECPVNGFINGTDALSMGLSMDQTLGLVFNCLSKKEIQERSTLSEVAFVCLRVCVCVYVRV